MHLHFDRKTIFDCKFFELEKQALGSHEFWLVSMLVVVSRHQLPLVLFVLFCLFLHQLLLVLFVSTPVSTSTKICCRTGDHQQGVDAANGGSAEGASLVVVQQGCIPRPTRAPCALGNGQVALDQQLLGGIGWRGG